MYKNILFGVFSLALLSACGGGGGGGGPTESGSPTQHPQPSIHSLASQHLGTARFTVYQPRVLEQIGAHYAYAEGLTGKGIRIGIDDSIVDYTQTREFGNRVNLRAADGAELSYLRPFGDDLRGEITRCFLLSLCDVARQNSGGDPEFFNNGVKWVVNNHGWPTRNDSQFLLDEYYSAHDPLERLFRWREVPTPYDQPYFGIPGHHGTTVASVAAGSNLGVAPGATIIPTAVNLRDDQAEATEAIRIVRRYVQELPIASRQQLDRELAADRREDHGKFDIINYSWGQRGTEFNVLQTVNDVDWLRNYLPNTLNAEFQANRPSDDKTIRVWAAGNNRSGIIRDEHRYPYLQALIPYYFSEVRGHWLAVAATDPRTGVIADYSHRCGPLPSNWNTAQHGPHYCLVAPGTVRGLVPNPNRPGNGDEQDGIDGTSFAAPLVSGSLALLMEHFRGTRGNTEIVKRMLDTADRSGRYADSLTYGAGHLDLKAALSPVGILSAGASGYALSSTSFQTPAAFGSVTQRTGFIELAAFDEQDFPFWVPLSGLISNGGAGRSPIPLLKDEGSPNSPTPGLDALNLLWMEVGGAVNHSTQGEGHWVMGFNRTSGSLEHRDINKGWGYGLSFDNAGHLGAKTSGAFGTDPRSGMVWVSRAFTHEFGKLWTLEATGMAALSLPRYEKDAMFQPTPSIMSAMSMRFGTESTGIVVEQPLRAETGTGRFRVENGMIENGKRLHNEFRVPLRPDVRELRMTLRHDFSALGGSIAMEVGGAMNVGHVSGQREANVGLAYRTTW